MLTSAKYNVYVIVSRLVALGVRQVVLCPGSRDASLIIAVKREPRLEAHVVIDERSAAFIALGMSLASGLPVALVCTSGSAVLNMAPAVAEAYYRRVPLIVISADRPGEWIDQDDSQTLRQAGVLGNIVKSWCHVEDLMPGDSRPAHRAVLRNVTDTLARCVTSPQGPVHINVEQDEPLTAVAEIDDAHLPEIDIVTARHHRDPDLDVLVDLLDSHKKILAVCGYDAPNEFVTKHLPEVFNKPNIVVMAEAQANIHGQGVLTNVDTVLRDVSLDLEPEVVITFGGALLSRHVKTWLRNVPGLKHWHVGKRDMSVDPFMALKGRIELPTPTVIDMLREESFCCLSDYRERWMAHAKKQLAASREFIDSVAWCDMVAVDRLITAMSPGMHLQVSNGTAIRYVQLCDTSHLGRVECNRGVSGIDGCTSTAVGYSFDTQDVTVLLTGDMSAQYDMGALASTLLTPRFKMAVLNNGGGGIFRFIASTRDLDELDECFVANVRLPIRQLAEGFGLAYFEADSDESMRRVLPEFLSENRRPAILNMITSPVYSNNVLTRYFNA